eukprot:831347-Amphidinium_carterae.2
MHSEEDLTRCMNRFCLHLACPDQCVANHIVCFCCDRYNRADEARTVPAPRRITDRWLLEHELKVRVLLLDLGYVQSGLAIYIMPTDAPIVDREPPRGCDHCRRHHVELTRRIVAIASDFN